MTNLDWTCRALELVNRTLLRTPTLHPAFLRLLAIQSWLLGRVERVVRAVP